MGWGFSAMADDDEESSMLSPETETSFEEKSSGESSPILDEGQIKDGRTKSNNCRTGIGGKNKKDGKRGPRLSIPPSPKPTGDQLPDHLEEVLGEKFTLILPPGDSSGEKQYVQVYARELERHLIPGWERRGRYGFVQMMKEPISGIIMAVKRIRERHDESQDFRYLEREVRACLRSGECPFLVRCFGMMRAEGDVWICMELLDSSLDAFYRTAVDLELPIPELFFARIAHSALTALHFMVKVLNLMHRDVKPSNMLVDKMGTVKLCDFGISGVVGSQAAKKTVQAGCKPYMAPERIDFEHPAYENYDERSDLWSLGISLIEMFTGSHPYDTWKDSFEQLNQVVGSDPPIHKLSSGPQCSDRFRDFICLCLTKDYDSRPKYEEMMQSDFITWYSEQLNNHKSLSDENVRGFVKNILDIQSANDKIILTRHFTGALKLT